MQQQQQPQDSAPADQPQIEAPKPADDDDSTQWAADVSEEAVRARMQDLTDGAKNMTLNDDLEKTEKERMDMLYTLIKLRRDSDQLSDVATQKELVAEAERLEIKPKAPLLLAELLFDQTICSQAKKHRVLILRFTLNDKKAQRYMIGGLEQVLALHKDALMAKVSGIFKLFYDLDILSEAAIIEWSDKISKKYVSKDVSQEIHKKAEPFIKWLQEAESEESDDAESSGDELEIEYNDRAKVGTAIQAPKPAQDKKEEDDADDFDIDAI